MKRRFFAVVAGIPSGFGDAFEARFHRRMPNWRIIAREDLDLPQYYTVSHATKLYERMAVKLKDLDPSGRDKILAEVHLVLLYLDRDNESTSILRERFGMETLTVPLRRPVATKHHPTTSNERDRVVNDLVREGTRAAKAAERVLAVIAEEVANRDKKTCLLLPPKNFGPEVCRFVQNAVSDRSKMANFKNDLEVIERALDTDEGRYFVGRRGLTFRSPSKARGRHALAPTWGDADHDPCCVVRGRLRFGAPFDPRFHYDCDLRNVELKTRDFPSCHGRKKLRRGRTHVNIAPNDNVR